MKKIILLLLFIAMFSCNSEQKTENLNNFIKEAKKPIICKPVAINIITGHITYTLASADGLIYNTGYIVMILPDTIKVFNDTIQ